jgi:hypothetical protein
MRLALCVWLIYIGAHLSWRAFETPMGQNGHGPELIRKAAVVNTRQ